jgi:hypothetical protein
VSQTSAQHYGRGQTQLLEEAMRVGQCQVGQNWRVILEDKGNSTSAQAARTLSKRPLTVKVLAAQRQFVSTLAKVRVSTLAKVLVYVYCYGCKATLVVTSGDVLSSIYLWL